jgi:hypothetical protein
MPVDYLWLLKPLARVPNNPDNGGKAQLRADATIDSHWSNRIVPGWQSRSWFAGKTADMLCLLLGYPDEYDAIPYWPLLAEVVGDIVLPFLMVWSNW